MPTLTMQENYVFRAMKWRLLDEMSHFATFLMSPCFTATVVCPCTRHWISGCSSHVRGHYFSLLISFLCEMYILYHSGNDAVPCNGCSSSPAVYLRKHLLRKEKNTPSTQASNKGELAPTCITAYLILIGRCKVMYIIASLCHSVCARLVDSS
uniref:Uncharacterized protein n=1 Tax=Rhipicephalus zambeziensis TaxID=60191 RepID=A0A224YGK9_9ACAR